MDSGRVLIVDEIYIESGIIEWPINYTTSSKISKFLCHVKRCTIDWIASWCSCAVDNSSSDFELEGFFELLMSEWVHTFLEIKLPVEQTSFITKSGSIQKDLHEFVTEWDSIRKSRRLKEQDF